MKVPETTAKVPELPELPEKVKLANRIHHAYPQCYLADKRMSMSKRIKMTKILLTFFILYWSRCFMLYGCNISMQCFVLGMERKDLQDCS